MIKSNAIPILFCFVFSCVCMNATSDQSPKEVEKWFDNLSLHSSHGAAEKTTKLHFYFHDRLNVTSATIAQANMTASSPTFFGTLIMANDPLTAAPDFGSKRVGYVRGFYGASSMEEVAVVMAMTFVLTDDVHKNSSISILGHNQESHTYRELPVVGGTGRFRMARGICTLTTYFYDSVTGIANIKVDVIIRHY